MYIRGFSINITRTRWISNMVPLKWIGLVLSGIAFILLIGINVSNFTNSHLWFNLQYYPGYTVPNFKEMNKNALYGRWVIDNTYKALNDNYVTSLSCTSCHIDGGVNPQTHPLIHSYYHYSKRNDLKAKINKCLVTYHIRDPLPAKDPILIGISEYLKFISTSKTAGDIE